MKNDQPIRILLIDDDEDDYILTQDVLEEIDQFNYELDWEGNYQSGLERVDSEKHDIYLIDYRLGEDDGISLIQNASRKGVSAPMILLTGKGDKDIDLKAMQYGAADYLVKGDITPHMMERTIRYALNNHKALQLVKESENKFRQLFEQSSDAIYITTSSQYFMDANPAFYHLLGYSHEELVEKKMHSLFSEEVVYHKFIEQLQKEGEVKDFDATLINQDGSKITCQLTSITRRDNSGNSIGYQGIIYDMTLKKKAEKELLLAERLSMTGKIARSVAHEVRNPLTNLRLAIDELEYLIVTEDEDIKDFIDIVKSNAVRIGELITEMLNSSKPKELDKTSVSIDELLDNAISLVKDRLKLKGMVLNSQYDKDNIEPILIDTEKMKTAIVNILINAVEAMEENKGVLDIKTSKLKNYVVIEIKDNGCGIKSEDLPTLFDPFYTQKQGGMGLGLTSVQNIIQSHNGAIDVVSELNEGTTFIISLPAAT